MRACARAWELRGPGRGKRVLQLSAVQSPAPDGMMTRDPGHAGHDELLLSCPAGLCGANKCTTPGTLTISRVHVRWQPVPGAATQPVQVLTSSITGTHGCLRVILVHG